MSVDSDFGEAQKKSTSTELTGGAGFTYEDTVVAYYLAALLREEGAALQDGIVKSVAVQQDGQGNPMDDLIVEFEVHGTVARLDLQVKTAVSISSGNTAFQDVVSRALATRAAGFGSDRGVYGFAAERISVAGLVSFERLIEWSKSSPDAVHFGRRFELDGASGEAERTMRAGLKPLLSPKNDEDEWRFYRQFVCARFDGLREAGILRSEIVNRLQELIEDVTEGQNTLLFDRLCRIARDGAGKGHKWTRASLLSQLRASVRLKVTPNYQTDINLIEQFGAAGIADIVDDIEGIRVQRFHLQEEVGEKLKSHRVVNISGLPGCGKSVVLRHAALDLKKQGPILFLKSDLLSGKSWLEFATKLGLKHVKADELLAEIGACGSSVLFIDGVDRINPDQKRIILDLLCAIEANPSLSGWTVLATSRDQGLETFRAWFPSSFYKNSAIGNVQVEPFNDAEAEALAAEKPGLRHLLMGAPAVRDISRRPFFAAVLARSFEDELDEPQTEADLINAWWARAGHDAHPSEVPKRQRALLDLAESGVGNLGKNVAARRLSPPTFDHVAALKTDLILRGNDGDASFSFTHDIFFEWAFFRLLIDLGPDWIQGLEKAGEPPLLGRAVGLLAQHSFTTQGKWSAGYQAIVASQLRPQWRREWLTAPPFTSAFQTTQKEFTDQLIANDFELFEKVLVWFQAQHTVPNPSVLRQSGSLREGSKLIHVAELLSWPSDFASWRRFLDWLIALAPFVPSRYIPTITQVFSVWQNALADTPNLRSKAILDISCRWLIDFEQAIYLSSGVDEPRTWAALGRTAKSQLATDLRYLIVRAARAYPNYANDLLDRSIANREIREVSYTDVMSMAWMMAEISPDKLTAFSKAEILEDLPQAKFDRIRARENAHYEMMQRIREKPESDRTVQEQHALESAYFPIGMDSEIHDDFGIDRHHSYYYPTSAMHEPFSSLFSKNSDVALKLVKDIVNHATKGWQQRCSLSRRRRGTPIPTMIEFPWGTQQFWGDWSVYGWHLGHVSAQPLECAFLALSHWAFQEIEAGKPVDEVIQRVVEGNNSVAAAGLSLLLALEKLHLSEVSLALVTCSRLWEYDIRRAQQEPTRNIDLLGMGELSRLTGDRAKAKEFLDLRKSRGLDVQRLALHFAVSAEPVLKGKFETALKAFPKGLPYEYEEQRQNPAVTGALTKQMLGYSAFSDAENYQGFRMPDNRIMVEYKPPLTANDIERGEAAGVYLKQQGFLGWAIQSLRKQTPQTGHSLEEAIALAKPLHHRRLFIERLDVGDSSPQSLVAAVAACVVCFQDKSSTEYSWAIDVLALVEKMREPSDSYYGSKIGWHPTHQLIYSLLHLRRATPADLKPAQRLLKLTAHPHQEAAEFAMKALLADSSPQVAWAAAQLVLSISHAYLPTFRKNGEWDHSAGRKPAENARRKAEKALLDKTPTRFATLPPAWIKDPSPNEDEDGEKVLWMDPNPSFDAKQAARTIRAFPIEMWCTLSEFKPLVLQLLLELVSWTSSRLNPPPTSGRRRDRQPDLIAWNGAIGDLLARAAVHFDINLVKHDFLSPFFSSKEGLDVIAAFADKTITLHVLDTRKIPGDTFELLDVCVDRAVSDATFHRGGYRSGEVSGHHLPRLIDALLLVAVERADGAARYVNGDWSEIGLAMPMVTRLVTMTGWSTYVMSKFLLLCERAGDAYPVDDFIVQASTVLADIDNAKGNWVGTDLAARTAATVQRLADANYPLKTQQAQGLLKILDALIDLGDRRSAALEQTEAFKSVQAPTRSRAFGAVS